MADIAALIVHGMGTQEPDFWQPLANDLDDRLVRMGHAQGSVAWQSGFWADLLTPHEEDLWRRSQAAGPLDFKSLRQFVVNALGDAVAYRRPPGSQDNVYDEIHARVHASLRTLWQTISSDLPLVVIAHSMGSVIMSDYIWNAQTQNRYAKGEGPFESMKTLSGFITFGSNIPLFSLAFPDPRAITFPPPELPPALAEVAEWNNYYDEDDVLGWPLKELSASYGAAVKADIEINVGTWYSSWSPASHTQYWGDEDFQVPVAEQLARVIKAVR